MQARLGSGWLPFIAVHLGRDEGGLAPEQLSWLCCSSPQPCCGLEAAPCPGLCWEAGLDPTCPWGSPPPDVSLRKAEGTSDLQLLRTRDAHS